MNRAGKETMDWHGERVVPESMDASSPVQQMTTRMYFQRYFKVRDWLKELFKGRRGRFLDIACGTGYGSYIFSEAGEVIGVDIDHDSVKYARSNYKNRRTSFLVGSADDINFLRTLGRFDAVISLATVEHIDNPQGFFSWVKDSLNPGGVFIVSFPSTFTMDWAAPHHKRDISRRAARRLFHEFNFQILETFNQREIVDMRYVVSEARFNKKMATPPLSQWIKYYLIHPTQMARRIIQMTAGGGILFEHQQYMLIPGRD